MAGPVRLFSFCGDRGPDTSPDWRRPPFSKRFCPLELIRMGLSKQAAAVGHRYVMKRFTSKKRGDCRLVLGVEVLVISVEKAVFYTPRSGIAFDYE
ncbi:hypothetical protein TNIN_354881 [Trichonephila inaurata madagascariensis]|uniref:Uncharacterized protein n=1 Tax=Trichonephila inaurata madagascariensis TaxID=2747483 RepID=A0A8X6IGR2_9ARAC|nr:hypothetical protein TNIN_354881 [Trichonephila inaurata madagascariensis]